MLRRLLIRDFVLVDRLELDFEPGFGALTGETGAGKSILLDALALVLGERADAGVVRHGRERAEVSAEFDLPPGGAVAAWLIAQDLADENDSLILRRVVEQGGRSRAYLNGAPATAAQLREVGELLADIHGQHAHHALLRGEAQRELLDAQAGCTPLAREVGALWRDWQAARAAREQAEQHQAAAAQERELLGWQVKELADLGFDALAWQETNAEHARLSHAAGLLEGAEIGVQALLEGEPALALESARLATRLTEMAQIDPALAEAAGLVHEAAIALDEAGHGLRRYRDRLELDPRRLTEVEARIAAVLQCARKYRVEPEVLPGLQAELQQRLAAAEAASDPQVAAARELSAQQAFMGVARQLSARRAVAAAALSAAVTGAMQELALAGGCFEAALIEAPQGCASGLETVEFLVAANPAQPLRPLAKVASGGELSRIGLAIQVIASQAQAVPTLVFDEVDVGIGGRVAEIVGRRLNELGQRFQVLAVTHLPQVAARADWQWRIAKELAGGAMVTRVDQLDRQARVDEIARMLGGATITETTRSHAAEMLGGDDTG